MPDPIPRTAARVLPVAPSGEVLLLQDQDPAHPGILRWGTIGGAVDEGESLVEAVLRELYEETGIQVQPSALTAPFLQGTYDFSWNGTSYRTDSTFFALPLAVDTPVSFEHLEEDEVGNVVQAGWWLPADLAADGGGIADDLPAIMESAVRAVLGEPR